MDDNMGKKNGRGSDRALVAFLAVISIFCVAVMVFFLIEYPIPFTTANGKGGLVVVIMGFIYLVKLFWPHLNEKIINDKRKDVLPAPGAAHKLGWKGTPLWKRICIVVGMAIYVVAIVFVFGAIILGLIFSLG
jgi:hypothetical protein